MKSEGMAIKSALAVIFLLFCATAQAQVYFFDDFENGLGKWEVSGQDWGLTDKSAFAGQYSFTDSPDRNYNNDINANAITLYTIDLTHAIFPILTFWTHYNINHYDRTAIYISTDGGFNWTEILARGTYNRNNWSHEQVDLRKYSGAKIKLRLYMGTCNGYEADGWYVDNLSIKEFEPGILRTLPFNESFDQGLEAWEISGHDWGLTNKTFLDGNYSFTDTPDGNYGDDTALFASIAGLVDLRHAAKPVLSFWHKYYLSHYDVLLIDISADSGWTWKELKRWSGAATLNSWYKEQLDLGEYKGKILKIRYLLFATGGYESDGWYIDKLSIYDAANETPIVDAFSATPLQGYKPLQVHFSCQAHDPDGTIAEYRWDPNGDGKTDTTTTTGSLTYIYAAAGAYDAACTVADNSGATATSQNVRITVLSSDNRRISLADTSAATGNTIKIPLRIDDASGVAALQGRLIFNPAILEATRIELGSLTQDFSLSDSLLAGKVAFSLAKSTSLTSGGGDLLYLSFLVKSTANAGDTCSMMLDKLALFDENAQPIPATAIKALFTVNGSASPAEFYLQPDTLALLPGQSLALSAYTRTADGQSTAAVASWTLEALTELGKTRLVATLSAGNGTQISARAVRIGDSRIIARSGDKSDTAWVYVKGLPGDVTADSLIMANDASQTLRAAVNLSLAPMPPGHLQPTLYERFAADYNQNKIINVDDAKLILDKSLEGLLRKSAIQPGCGPAVVTLGSAAVLNNGRTIVPLYVRLRRDVGAARVELRFDPDALSFCAIVPAIPGTIWLLNDTAPGKVVLGLIHSESLINVDGEFLQLQFRSDRDSNEMNLSIESVELFDCQARPITASIEAGDQSMSVVPQGFSLEQNYPNPFNPTTTVCCQLPRESHVRLAVFNSSGQLAKTLFAGLRPAGILLTTWDGRDEGGQNLSSGIYFCWLDIDQGRYRHSIKLLLMR